MLRVTIIIGFTVLGTVNHLFLTEPSAGVTATCIAGVIGVLFLPFDRCEF